MKTSEEKLNEALREALKRKFDDFGDQPNPSSYNLIRARLKQPRNFKYLFFTILFVGLFVGSIVIDQHWVRQKNAVNSKSVSQTETNDKVLDSNTTTLDGSAAEKENAISSTAKTASANFKTKRADLAAKSPVENSVQHISERKVMKQSATLAETPAFQEKQESGVSTLPDQNAVLENTQLLANEIEDEPEATRLPDVNRLNPEAMKFEKMHIPEVALSGDIKTSNAIHANSTKVGWLLNVASLKTYQIITVPKTNGRDFQNFKFPSAFSLETLGYKVSGGFEKNGFQFMLHYSLFRQSYSYEIAGNEYVVHAVDGKDFQVVRRGMVVNENRKMELLGVGINKQVLWGKSPLRKYYATAGLEYSRTLSGSHDVGWISVGAGKQIPLNNQVLIHVGPYAEFSPVKVPGSGDPFYYQPYRVGISLGLKLIKP
ncbi:hypothetical protein [Dyadobacter sp. CY323]|uniref:hypothetical protein n=1 Tax=Dyadobacter sp. CY323 TaxID=2907302 RepID=UPI001F44CCA4|nr:hypothetical protein [Dyadobacter sp. CY323]MCE6987994.1 hypothetical protein [Dyadobacter sp. CY323]